MTSTNTENVPMTPTNQPSLFGKLVSYFKDNIMKIRDSTQRTTTIRKNTRRKTKKTQGHAGKSTRRKTTISKTQRRKTNRKIK